MDFELTISGLCLVAMKTPKAEDPEPSAPLAVDVYCPVANHPHPHRTVLTYDPEHAKADFEPEMVVDDQGKRFASVDLGGSVWSLSFEDGPKQFNATWGKPSKHFPKPGEEPFLNWVPKLGDLKLRNFQPAATGLLPTGARTRLVLPPGKLEAADIVTKKGGTEYAMWKFSGNKNIVRALANHVRYSATGITSMRLVTPGRQVFSSRTAFRMALSNDLAVVATNYLDPVEKLEHLEHLKGMAGIQGTFAVPTPGPGEVQQTIKPICNSVIAVYS